MTPPLLAALGVELFGERWQRPMAASLGVSPSAVSQWLAGASRVPGPVAAALSAWRDLKDVDGRRPPAFPGATERFSPRPPGGVRGRKPRYASLLTDPE